MNNNPVIIGVDTKKSLAARTPGHGTMRLAGEDVWGEPKDSKGAINLLRKAVGLGVINKLLADALYFRNDFYSAPGSKRTSG